MRTQWFAEKLTTSIRSYWRDLLIAFVFAVVAGCASYEGMQVGMRAIPYNRYDSWFGADTPRVFHNMIDRESDHFRTKVHPLFSLLTYTPGYVLRNLFGMTPLNAVRLIVVLVASLWIGTFFILLRLVGCRRFDSCLFSILAMVSATSIFWFVLPETYPFGSLSILLALTIVGCEYHKRLADGWYIGVNALTLSFTTTNWMAGLAATFASRSWKRSVQIAVNGFCLVVLLWGLQKVIFPSAVFFLGDSEETRYVVTPTAGGVLHVVNSFVFHTVIMPAINVMQNVRRPDLPDWPLMYTQLSSPGSGTAWGEMAAILWAALLALGLWVCCSHSEHSRLGLCLGLTIAGQLLLHTVYGDETFLYSLHFLPLLMVVAALSTLTPARPLALVLAGIVTIGAAINNGIQLNKAIASIEGFGPARRQTQIQMQRRPAEPWPRGIGHVVLAAPGSRETDKAYYEPGGGFSPIVGSFGISIWVTDKNGSLKVTSDTIPMHQLRESFTWPDHGLPGISTKTPYYQAEWLAAGERHWMLDLKPAGSIDERLALTIRSVGPAGGPITSLSWDRRRLVINHRWAIEVDPVPDEACLGEEGAKNWLTKCSSSDQWYGDKGWGYARLTMPTSKAVKIAIQDSAPESEDRPATAEIEKLNINLPDEQFTGSLNAQVAHLMMSLVGNETRPGDPMNYPLAWLRDGAYVVVALAQAGQLKTAQQLSTYFAENDFFGGFGSEADAPGLAIWVLEEVAARLKRSDYDLWIWPHIRRKAEIIMQMLSTDRPIYWPFVGPAVPEVSRRSDLTLVADAAKNGLVVGRMDFHRPLLFVNAVTYRGLLAAASVAERVGQSVDAKRWHDRAAALKQSWKESFKPPESQNDRTYVNGLWPTWVALSAQDLFLQNLERRWTDKRDVQGNFRTIPLWTYFDVAEAHQWLYLGRQDRTWKTLHWFWEHQASPGLFTWWEGEKEENTFNRWERVRGWVNPPHVTPHYWTAAEMLLLQLDMLAYLDESGSVPTLVVGAGVPSEWLDKRMNVQGLSTRVGLLDWTWDGKKMRVRTYGCQQCRVRLGSAFPPNTMVEVEHAKPQ